MYNRNIAAKTSIINNDSSEGETIETKMKRVVELNEPITDGAARQYTDREEGVKAEYNIRTDRFEIAVEATDYIQKTHIAKREERLKAIKGGDGQSPSSQGTGDTAPTT